LVQADSYPLFERANAKGDLSRNPRFLRRSKLSDLRCGELKQLVANNHILILVIIYKELDFKKISAAHKHDIEQQLNALFDAINQV
jgi:hypothetical protein